MAEKIMHGVHQIGEALSIPRNETVAAVYGGVPQVEHHTRTPEVLEHIAQAAGNLVSIPKQEAVDASSLKW